MYSYDEYTLPRLRLKRWADPHGNVMTPRQTYGAPIALTRLFCMPDALRHRLQGPISSADP